MNTINTFSVPSVIRRDARDKVDGTLLYLDDRPFEGLYGAVVRSPVARGILRGVVFDSLYDWSGIVSADASDIPGENICPGVMEDQPFLAERELRFIGEPVALIACADRHRLREALAHITVEYDPLPAVLSLEASEGGDEILFGDDNCFKTITISKGDAEAVFASGHCRIIERVYETGAQEHLYLEPQSMEALHQGGAIKVVGSMQCPGYVSGALERLCGEKIEIEQTPTGGAFGGKEDYPSLMAAYVYLLARKSGKNVRLVYGRSEDIAYTTKRHRARISYRGAVDERGRITALSVQFDLDAGAYATLSPVVLSRGVLHCCGLYDIPNIDVLGRALATNIPPAGAFRGFGAPQAVFGIERFMDDVARELGSDPLSFRRLHLPDERSTTLTGASCVHEASRLRALLERAAHESDYLQRHDSLHPAQGGMLRGIGMALFMHGGGFTGSGEKMLASRVRLEARSEGKVSIRIINTEMGQGALTVLPQIVAQELGIGIECVVYETPNTFSGAPSGPTVASRTTMVVGDLLRRAARRLKEAVGAYEGEKPFREALRKYLENGGKSLFEAEFEQPEGIVWDEEHYRGEAYLGYSLGCYVAEVAIDPVSCRASVTAFYALSDIGEVVNETLAIGQVQGGIVQALGYALQEEVLYREGRVQNPRLSDYMIPIASDVPGLDVRFMAGGEKAMGLGELPMDGAGAAIANAVSDALKEGVTTLPITPQKIMEMSR